MRILLIIIIRTVHIFSFQVPLVIPIIVLLVSLFLVIAPIADKPQVEFLYAGLFIVAGLIFYVPFVYYQKELPGMGMFLDLQKTIYLII